MAGKAEPISRQVPGWIVTLRLNAVGVPHRIVAALLQRGMERAGDCIRDDLVRPEPSKQFKAAINEAQARVLAAAEWLDTIANAPFEIKSGGYETTLLGWLRRTLDRLPEQDRNVIAQRLGVDCERKTRDELSACFGLTPQALASTENRWKRQCVGSWLVAEETENRIEERLKSACSGLGVRHLCEQDEWFAGLQDMPYVVKFILRELTERSFSVVRVGAELYVCRVQQGELDDALKAGRLAVREAGDTPTTELRRRVRQHLPEACPELERIFRRVYAGRRVLFQRR